MRGERLKGERLRRLPWMGEGLRFIRLEMLDRQPQP